jgi:hypothetical protein
MIHNSGHSEVDDFLNSAFFPQVRYLLEGTEEAELFSQLLLDDEPASHHSEMSEPARKAVSSPTAAGEETLLIASPVASLNSRMVQDELDLHSSFGLSQFVDHVRGHVLLHLASSLMV